MWRTVEFVRQIPEIRFNGDFSHWYTGQEMVYGGFDRQAPVHPASPLREFVSYTAASAIPAACRCASNLEQDPEPVYVTHFRQLWTASFITVPASSRLSCSPPSIYYARTLPDGTEESDRWQQSLVLKRIAEGCWEDAHD